MSKRALTLFLAAAASLPLLYCGGQKDEDALMEDEAPATAAPATSAAAPAAAPAAPATGGATLTGKVNFEGAKPSMAAIKMDADAYCKSEHKEPVYDQEVVVNPNNTLQWVLVYVKEGASGNYPVPTEPITLDQHGCQYRPHIFGVMAGQPIKILNSDGTLHNIHAIPTKNQEFNTGQPIQGMKTDHVFTAAETMVPFKCDVHGWMNAYAGVLPHPYFAVTSEDGTFTIKNLPPGTYKLTAWHEKLGTQTADITLAAKDDKENNFTFKAAGGN